MISHSPKQRIEIWLLHILIRTLSCVVPRHGFNLHFPDAQ